MFFWFTNLQKVIISENKPSKIEVEDRYPIIIEIFDNIHYVLDFTSHCITKSL